MTEGFVASALVRTILRTLAVHISEIVTTHVPGAQRRPPGGCKLHDNRNIYVSWES